MPSAPGLQRADTGGQEARQVGRWDCGGDTAGEALQRPEAGVQPALGKEAPEWAASFLELKGSNGQTGAGTRAR